MLQSQNNNKNKRRFLSQKMRLIRNETREHVKTIGNGVDHSRFQVLSLYKSLYRGALIKVSLQFAQRKKASIDSDTFNFK